MAIEITVPTLGESVTEATVGQWFKKPGDAVAVDEPLLELETDKVTVEVPAPAAGVLADIKVPQGTTVAVGSVLGSIAEGAARQCRSRNEAGERTCSAAIRPACGPSHAADRDAAAAPSRRRVGHAARDFHLPVVRRRHAAGAGGAQADGGEGALGRRRAGLRPTRPDPEGGRAGRGAAAGRALCAGRGGGATAAGGCSAARPAGAGTQMRAPSVPNDAAREERVKMTRLRQTIARRLKDAQNTAAMLTTFNDVDMSAIMNAAGTSTRTCSRSATA